MHLFYIELFIFVLQVELAFRLMLTGRPELIQQAVPLLPTSTRLDTLNPQGHTTLMLAAIHNDDMTLSVKCLECCLSRMLFFVSILIYTKFLR